MARTLIRGSTQIMDLTITNAQIDATAGIELSKIENGANILVADGTTGAIANLDMGGFQVVNAGAATEPDGLVTKAQLDAVSAGLDAKEASHVASTGPIDTDTGGLLTIDGEVLTAGQRVLVKDQTDAIDNGIYVALAGAWVRAADFDGSPANEVSGGSYTFVSNGAVNGATGWIVVAEGDITVGTDEINWTKFSSAAAYTGGNGIGVSGSVISGDADESTITTTGGSGAQFAIVAGGVDSAQIATGAVDTTHIAADAIDSTLIADNAVNSEHIASGAVDGSHVANGAIDSVHIASGAVDGTHIANGAVDSIAIASGAVDGTHIADSSIDSNHVVAGAIDGTHIADSSIDSNHLIAGAVDTTHIAADAIDSTLIADNAVNSEHITAGAVDGTHIANSSIDSAHLVAGAVDGTHIADNAVDSNHIAAGAIDSTHLSADFIDGIGPGLAGDGLLYDSTTDTLYVNVDGSTIEIASDVVGIKDGGVGATQLAAAAFGAGILGGDGTTITLDPDVVATWAAEIKYSWPAEAIATNTLNYTFNGGNPIVTNTFELYLNGVLLEPGSGNDYTFNYTTGIVTFASIGDAPRSNDKLYANFVDVA